MCASSLVSSGRGSGVRSIGGATLVLASLAAAEARAGEFFEDGSFVFDASAVATVDFEDGVPEPTDPEEPPIVRVESETALSGRYVIEVMPYGEAGAPLSLPALRRTYRVSLWVRGGDAVGLVAISHDGRDGADELASLYPTGRVTSDGWVELANQGIRFDGARSGMFVGVFCPGGCEMDAIEVVPEGVIDGEVNAPCKGAADGSACGVGQICLWSECRNVNAWVPPIPADREDVTAYLENRLRFLFGPYLERSIDMPGALSALAAMRAADDPWTYWNSFMLAVRRLHDGHTGTSGIAQFVLDNPKRIMACFVEGDADLTHATAPADPIYRDILVSHVGAQKNLGLGPGDRLVRVDGEHPIAWYRSLVQHNWGQPAISNRETFAELASSLRSAISRYADSIEVIRCDATTVTCGSVETISIAELPPLEEGEEVPFIACDNRPVRHVPGAPDDHAGSHSAVHAGLLDASDPTEKIYGIEWDSLYTTDGNDGMGANMKKALKLLSDDAARGVIFDHRTGTGGTIAGPELIWSFAVPRQPLTYTEERRRAEDEQPSPSEGALLFQQAQSLGLVDWAGSNNPTSMPVALLITQDVSASDWLPLGMKLGGDNVRVFGPYATNGAFSTRFQLGYWLGMSIVLASGDSFVADGTTLAGTGVEPDVAVLPKQSDLLQGKDTVFEAALAWVRQELTP